MPHIRARVSARNAVRGLSWDLARWFEERLGTSDAGHRAVAAARLRAASTRHHDAIDRALGLPLPQVARRLVDDLFAQMELQHVAG